MREYSTAELDLMAKAYERAYGVKLQTSHRKSPPLASDIVESLVNGIADAVAWGERDEERLVFAALSRANSVECSS